MVDLHYVYFLTFNISMKFDLLSSGRKEPLFRLSDFLFVLCAGWTVVESLLISDCV